MHVVVHDIQAVVVATGDLLATYGRCDGYDRKQQHLSLCSEICENCLRVKLQYFCDIISFSK